MSERQLTNEEQIISTRSIFNSSYGLASGGIPSHVHMLEQIVEGRGMDDHTRQIFLSLSSSNLLAIPGVTLYLTKEDKEEAVDYFGQDISDKIDAQNKAIKQLAMQGDAAILRHHFYPASPWNFEPLLENEKSDMVEEAISRGYFAKSPKPLNEWEKKEFFSVADFKMATFNAGGVWAEIGMEALSGLDELWLTEPLYSRAIGLHIKKLGLMAQILRYAIGKADELKFADIDVFDPKTYFQSQHSYITIQKWEASFQKHFGISVPSAARLLELSERVLTEAQKTYQINIR